MNWLIVSILISISIAALVFAAFLLLLENGFFNFKFLNKSLDEVNEKHYDNR